MHPVTCCPRPSRATSSRLAARRAVAVVQVAISLTFIFGFAALVIDIGKLYTTQTELQVAADAAALAAAAELGQSGDVVAAANQYAQLNNPKGYNVRVYSGDVELGTAPLQGDKYVFTPGGVVHDAVRVTVCHTEGGGPVYVSYLFAPVLNQTGRTLEARAAAMLVPRDIAVVNDISNSMNYDSSLRSERIHRTDGGYSNLRDLWCALDGPEPSRPYIPADAAHVDQTEYQYDTGPTYGEMKTWGSPLVPGSYSASSDPGLWYIPKNASCTVAAAQTSLEARGYSSGEISVLLSGSRDGSYSSQWKNRVKVILGLYTWHSGKSGGKDPTVGDGDDYVESAELTQDVPVPWFAKSWNWDDYIGSQRSGFTYRFGLKTLVDFMLYQAPRSTQSDQLWATPQQPLRATKDALNDMANYILEQESLDHMSLAVFCGQGSATRHEVDLTGDLMQVPNTFYQRQSGHYDVYTNMGGGLYWGVAELKSARARPSAAKVIVLMSDGYPNRWDPRSSLALIDQLDDPNNPHSWADEYAYAYAMAEIAAYNNIRIYCISVGSDTDRTIMQDIAAIGGGEEFYAHGNPEEYTEQLREYFRKIGGRRPVELIE